MKKQYILLGSLIILLSCNNIKSDKNIVLKIGKLEITKYEFEKNKTRELVINGTDSSSLTNSTKLTAWKKNYIDKCMIIADAYEKQYDTIGAIKNEIKHVGDFMMVQRYGYLWKQTITPIVDRDMVVTKEKIEKRKKLYYFDYVSCKSVEELLKLTNNDTLINNKEEFLRLKSQYSQNKALHTGYFSIQWPFLSFWNYREYIYNMKQGSVSKLLRIQNNYMYFYLDHVEEIPITQKEKDNILTEIQLGTEEELIKKGTAEMAAKCRPVINQTSIDAISQFLSKGNSINQFKRDIELIRYYINDTLKRKGFNEFLDYYSNLVIREEITNKENLLAYVNEFYADDYLINEAKKLNLYNTEIFKLDQKNYRNNVLFGKYFEHEIFNNIKIDSFKITQYYVANKTQFKQPKNIIASMYVFDKKSDALINKNKIAELLNRKEASKTKDTANIKGLIQFVSDVKIDLDNTGEYSPEFINTLLGTPQGQISQQPVEYQNKYVTLLKIEENGESIRQLKDVYNNIESKLRAEKSEVERQALVNRLKSQYKVEIDKTNIPN